MGFASNCNVFERLLVDLRDERCGMIIDFLTSSYSEFAKITFSGFFFPHLGSVWMCVCREGEGG